MKIIDLTQKMFNEMPVHPYDDGITIVQDKFLEKDAYNNTRIELGMHTGTHIDAPKHLVKVGKGIEVFPLSHFIGNGCILDVRGEDIISMKKEYKTKIKQNDIVLLFTGYGEIFGSEKYYGNNMPTIDMNLAQHLVEKKVKMLGMDLPSPDNYPFLIHNELLSNNVLIIENMANLKKLLNENKFQVMAMPLSLHAEASITRAIAIID